MFVKPVRLPSMTLPTRAFAKKWVREQIKDHSPLETVVSDPLHVAVLFDLLERDDDASDKIGVGVKEFFIRRTALGKGRVQSVGGTRAASGSVAPTTPRTTGVTPARSTRRVASPTSRRLCAPWWTRGESGSASRRSARGP